MVYSKKTQQSTHTDLKLEQTEMKQEVKKYSRDLSPLTELLDSYTVKSLPRGYVLIINNENYAESTGYSKRLGSAQDVQKLCSLFQEFSYSVAVLQDPKGDEFMKAVRSFASKEELGKVDAAGLIILSHGLQHHVIASDGTLVNLDSVVSCFTTQNCPLLAGKPKLLILQACRGEGRDYGASTTGSGRSSACGITAVDYSLGPASWVSLPYMCDAVIAFSTLPGFVSWRSEKEGSWYISKLVEVFHQLGRSVHVMDLLTQVNNKMVEESGSNKFQQMAQIVTTLRKLYFLSTVTE
ncbi:unnamed protein product [Calicophoron daubneyi]|uniref:Uncharacterized protein n=1 Tax=Calicophoron daubneyi TaxID=300641 RepID=A0AAV2T4I1_CALDB